jgi:anti-anti-sigma factor
MERRRSASRDVVYQDKQLVVTQTQGPLGLRFLGAVDASNVAAVAGLLEKTLRTDSAGDVHVDVTGLEFSDVSGIRALVAAAERADGTRKLVLHGLPALMTRVMDVVGWTDLPALTISDADFPYGTALNGNAPNSGAHDGVGPPREGTNGEAPRREGGAAQPGETSPGHDLSSTRGN